MKITITESMIKESIEYAEKGHKFMMRRMDETVEEHKCRLFVGHLTELVGNKCLIMRGYTFIYPIRYIVEEDYVDDGGDFIIEITSGKLSGKKLVCDAKSASKSFHHKILVPHDQYEKKNVDLYLGIKLYSWNKSETSIYPTFDETAKVHGWAYHSELNLPDKASSTQFPAYWIKLKDLHSLTELDNLIQPPVDARNVFK